MPRVSLFSTSPTSSHPVLRPRASQVPEQGGLLSHVDPTAYDPADPLRIWIIQLVIIIGTAQLLSLGLRRIRQPKVIAEVIGGIVLGPTLMGRVPGFTEHMFPSDSIPYLSLTANIGLVLFLFLVGLEIDLTSIRSNVRTSALISLGGMILPFSIGSGMARVIFDKFVQPITPGTTFTHFLLFVGVAYSITAFPVLCRILTELKLLDTNVGICVLSAGVGNDIVGWTLLALSIALVNASSGITALYIVLLAIAWAVFLLVPVKWLLRKFARYSCPNLGEEGPSVLFMTVMMCIVFGSAFFTDVIGVHAIFGGFLAGLIVPREGGLAIKMMEKMEDLVTIVFLPIYFTISGLSTNLGLLNTGMIWGYTIAIIVTAWIGKFVGATTGARLAAIGGGGVGKGWRECSTVGVLMSCKGLVELIVLNVGLQAGILSTLVFSMFVLEALSLTFFTTPVVVTLYPPHIRRRVGTALLGHTSKVLTSVGGDLDKVVGVEGAGKRRKVTVVLDRLEHLPGMVSMVQLLRPASSALDSLKVMHGQGLSTPSSSSDTRNDEPSELHLALPPSLLQEEQHQPQAVITALRLIALSDRQSAVMKSMAVHENDAEREAMVSADPLLGVFRTFGGVFGFGVRCALEVIKPNSWAETIRDYARIDPANEMDNLVHGGPEGSMVVVGWVTPSPPPSSTTATHIGYTSSAGITPATEYVATPAPTTAPNPFDAFFSRQGQEGYEGGTPEYGRSLSVPTTAGSTNHSLFLRSVFSMASHLRGETNESQGGAGTVDVALYVDQRFSHPSPISSGTTNHSEIFVPFFGGPDDRLALELVCSMCSGTGRAVRGVVVWFKNGPVEGEELDKPKRVYNSGDTLSSVLGRNDMTTPTMSGFPDTIYGDPTTATRLQSDTADQLAWDRFSRLCSSDSSSRVRFSTQTTPSPLHMLLQRLFLPTALGGRRLVLLGRSRRLTPESHFAELKELLLEDGGGGGRNGSLAHEVRKTVGDVATAVMVSGAAVDLVVVQAGLGGRDV